MLHHRGGVAHVADVERMMLPGRAVVRAHPRHVHGRIEIPFAIVPNGGRIGQFAELLLLREQPETLAAGRLAIGDGARLPADGIIGIGSGLQNVDGGTSPPIAVEVLTAAASVNRNRFKWIFMMNSVVIKPNDPAGQSNRFAQVSIILPARRLFRAVHIPPPKSAGRSRDARETERQSLRRA